MSTYFTSQKPTTTNWCGDPRDQIVEALRNGQTEGPITNLPAGCFEHTVTTCTADDDNDASGGVVSVMCGGRVFEKVGENSQLASRALYATQHI